MRVALVTPGAAIESPTGERARLQGLNVVGMKRHGLARAEIQVLSQAYARLFGEEDTLAERVERLAQDLGDAVGVAEIVTEITRAPEAEPAALEEASTEPSADIQIAMSSLMLRRLTKPPTRQYENENLLAHVT